LQQKEAITPCDHGIEQVSSYHPNPKCIFCSDAPRAPNAKLREWLASDLSKLDLLAIQIDGLHISDERILVAAVGIDGRGEKHPLGLVEGATENAATVQALLDNLVERGLDPAGVWLFIIDGAKALSKAISKGSGCGSRVSADRPYRERTGRSGGYVRGSCG
jgi:hypothetical protein